MQIWLDTIDLKMIEEASHLGLLSGVTTNPSILSQTRDVRETCLKILDIQPGPVAVQVTSSETDKIIEEGFRIFEFSKRMIVKVPINLQGLKAIKELHKHHIPIMGTALVFSHQALLSSLYCPAFIAPYFSHIGNSDDAWAVIQQMMSILKNAHSETKILLASLKKMEHVIQAAVLGIDAVTLPEEVYRAFVQNQALVEGFIQKFSIKWTEKQGSISIADALFNPIKT